MQQILLGVSGSIACYKAAVLVRLLRARGAGVQVVLTSAAAALVGAPTFRALSSCPVLQDEWQAPDSADGMDHIAAARRADVLLVAPASADFIAKAAAGIADNLLLATFLSADCSRYLAPAMNQQMWAAAATQRNIRQLQADGVHILGPGEGEQACGESGMGRMSEPEAIADALLATPTTEQVPQPPQTAAWFSGRRVVVSSGATVEALDAMRIISNRSSGETGFCLAQALQAAGARVQLIAGQTTAAAPAGIPLRRALSGDAMRQAVLEEAAHADWFFSAAAVADFRLPPRSRRAKGKPAREKGDWTLTLTPTADILSEVASTYPRLKCLAFAAQSGAKREQEKAARLKMKRKGACYIVLNDVAAAGNRESQLTLLFGERGRQVLPCQPKAQAVRALVAAIVSQETEQEKSA